MTNKILDKLVELGNNKPTVFAVGIALAITAVLFLFTFINILIGHAVAGAIIWFTALAAKDKFLRAFDFRMFKK